MILSAAEGCISKHSAACCAGFATEGRACCASLWQKDVFQISLLYGLYQWGRQHGQEAKHVLLFIARVCVCVC